MKKNVLYHGSTDTDFDFNKKCLYVTPEFVYATLYSADFSNNHGCVFELEPAKNLNIFDARNNDDLSKLKAAYNETGNTLRIDLNRLKEEDWSTVCFRQDHIRDKYLLPLVKDLGYDGYFNFEFDDGIAKTYADGVGGCGMLNSEPSIGIFDSNLLNVVGEIKYKDFFDNERFCECFKADMNAFVDMIKSNSFTGKKDARKYAGNNFPFLDKDDVRVVLVSYF